MTLVLVIFFAPAPNPDPAEYITLNTVLIITTKITMGGTYDQPFGNKAWVLVRKGGASQVIKAKYSRLDVIFNRQGFDNSSKEKQMSYMDL